MKDNAPSYCTKNISNLPCYGYSVTKLMSGLVASKTCLICIILHKRNFVDKDQATQYETTHETTPLIVNYSRFLRYFMI